MNSLIKLNNSYRIFVLNSSRFIKCSYSTNNNNNNENNSPFSKNSKFEKKVELSKENQILLEDIEAEAEEFADVKPFVNPKTGEIGGPRGPEPTRYNDWERAGRVSDF